MHVCQRSDTWENSGCPTAQLKKKKTVLHFQLSKKAASRTCVCCLLIHPKSRGSGHCSVPTTSQQLNFKSKTISTEEHLLCSQIICQLPTACTFSSKQRANTDHASNRRRSAVVSCVLALSPGSAPRGRGRCPAVTTPRLPLLLTSSQTSPELKALSGPGKKKKTKKPSQPMSSAPPPTPRN